jgi:hypothetical protein
MFRGVQRPSNARPTGRPTSVSTPVQRPSNGGPTYSLYPKGYYTALLGGHTQREEGRQPVKLAPFQKQFVRGARAYSVNVALKQDMKDSRRSHTS